jgi:hypothetical protein
MARIAALTTNASDFGSIRVSIRAVSIAKAYQLGAEHLCEAVNIETKRSAAAGLSRLPAWRIRRCRAPDPMRISDARQERDAMARGIVLDGLRGRDETTVSICQLACIIGKICLPPLAQFTPVQNA